MAGGIKIPVSAELSTEDVSKAVAKFTQDFNRLGAQISAANRVKFTPVSKATIDDVKKLEAGFQALLRVNGDLRSRMQKTGQQGSGFFGLDWGKLYPGELQRGWQMQRVFEHVGGARFSTPAGGGGHPGGGAPGSGSAVGGAVRQAVGAGLNAMGPAGGVANGALGAGMRGGLGAGLMGLGGGLAALAIGKIFGAVSEGIDDVIQEDIKYAKLRRQLGTVGVGHNALKAAVRGSAAQTGLTFDEAQDLTAQYIRQGNVSNRDWRGVGEEVSTAANFGRSFGVDQSAAVGAFGTLRLFGAGGNDQQMRRMALLIGEGIGKSGAFAKSEEFLQAIAGYTEQQARSGLSAPNVAAFTSMLAGMVGSKTPGLDAKGSAETLAKMNSTYAAGGGAGEAGQNFLNASLGRGGKLDPMDVTFLREQGMFGTFNSAFGTDAAPTMLRNWYKKSGIPIPRVDDPDVTGFDLVRRRLEKSYGGSPQMKKLMANAMSNLFGINNTQAAAMLSIDPARLGGIGQRLGRLGIDLKNVNATGISEMAQIESNKSMSEAEKDKAMREAATRGMDKSVGDLAKDQIAELKNLKSIWADKLVPLTYEMRDGIMWLAGGSKGMSSADIRKAMAKADSESNVKAIMGQYSDKQRAVLEKIEEARKLPAGPERTKKMADLEEELKRVREEQRAAIKKENDALERHNKALDDEAAALRKRAEERDKRAQLMKQAEVSSGGAGAGAGRGFLNPQTVPGAALADTSSIDAQLAEAELRHGLPPGTLKSVIQQETGGRTAEFLADPAKYHYGLNADGKRIAGHTGQVSTAFGPFGILESTGAKPGYGVAPLKDKSIEEQIRFASEYLAARTRAAGSLQGGLAGYGEGERYARSVMSRVAGSTPLPERPGMAGTPIPDTGAETPAERDRRLVVEVTGGAFTLNDQRGQELARTTPQISARVGTPQPSGM